MTTIPLDEAIAAFVAGHPWLKVVLTVAYAVMGVGKARGWFARRYGIAH